MLQIVILSSKSAVLVLLIVLTKFSEIFIFLNIFFNCELRLRSYYHKQYSNDTDSRYYENKTASIKFPTIISYHLRIIW